MTWDHTGRSLRAARFGILSDRGSRRRMVSTLPDLRTGDLQWRCAPAGRSTPVAVPAMPPDSRDQARCVHPRFIRAMLKALEAKDPYTAHHSRRVGAYAQHIAERFGLNSQLTEAIHVAGLLHDIGKLDIPDAILTKPGRLSAEEFDQMKRHSALGTELLRPIGLSRTVISFIRHHHEWHDGHGYPDGLCGDSIPFGAKIIQTADCIDAMMSPRSYKRGLSVLEVLSELRTCSGTQFDPDVAKVAMQWLADATPPNNVEDHRLEMSAHRAF